jgi:CRP/FNR family transcriptional regulator
MLDQDQYERIAKGHPLLKRVDPQFEREFKQEAFLARFPVGKDLFIEGDRVDAIPLLISGSVRVYQIGETGREVTLYRFRPGESCVLTATSIFNHQTFPAIATVEEEAEAVMIPEATFSDWIRRFDVWRDFVFDLVTQRLASVMTIVDQVAFRKLDHRLAEFLLKRGRQSNPSEITHQEIAAELGSSREVISRILDDFSGQGAIQSSRGRIEIVDFESLRTRASM